MFTARTSRTDRKSHELKLYLKNSVAIVILDIYRIIDRQETQLIVRSGIIFVINSFGRLRYPGLLFFNLCVEGRGREGMFTKLRNSDFTGIHETNDNRYVDKKKKKQTKHRKKIRSVLSRFSRALEFITAQSCTIVDRGRAGGAGEGRTTV